MHRSPTLPALTGLRGLAALLIVIVHLQLPEAITKAYPLLANVKEAGWIGVPVFFALSGFLITWLGLKERERTGRFRLTRFYLRRSLRIVPLYLAVVTLGLHMWSYPWLRANYIAAAPEWAASLYGFYANVTAARLHSAFGLNALTPLWTLAAEMQFYLLWGACLYLLPKRGLWVVAMALFALSWFYRLAPEGFAHFLLYRMHPGVSLGSLMIGCLIALACDARQPAAAPVAALGIGLILCAATIILSGWPHPLTTPEAALLMGITDMASAILLLLAIHGSNRLALALSAKPIQSLGEISYCLYMVHVPVIMLFYHLRAALSWLPYTQESPFVMLAVESALIFLICLIVCLAWEWLETPFRRWRHKLR